MAGRSGGAHEAVADGETGAVVDDPTDVEEVAAVISGLLADPGRRDAMSTASRERAKTEFSYDVLAERLAAAIDAMVDA